MIWSILLQIFFGILKSDMVYVSSELSTEVTKVALSAHERAFVFQATSLPFGLSTKMTIVYAFLDY